MALKLRHGNLHVCHAFHQTKCESSQLRSFLLVTRQIHLHCSILDGFRGGKLNVEHAIVMICA
jgi:hypothetical protein